VVHRDEWTRDNSAPHTSGISFRISEGGAPGNLSEVGDDDDHDDGGGGGPSSSSATPLSFRDDDDDDDDDEGDECDDDHPRDMSR
jgi:hypothetical protein